jgi:hypothetical protein
MQLRQALDIVLGSETAARIIADHGEHWAFVAAVAAATTDTNPLALEALDRRLTEIDGKPRGRRIH